MLRFLNKPKRVLTLAIGACVLAAASSAWGADATVLDTDPNVDGLGFGKTDPFAYGGVYSQDATAVFNGNDLLVQTQDGASFNTGAGISVPVSNGENGINQSLDGGANQDVNPDVPNATPANSVFTTIGNASGKIENGNVIRYSMWVRSDPNNPITKAPQIEPVFKLEFWKEALSTFAHPDPGAQPLYGDKIVDTDQHLGQGIWIDLNNNGSVIDAAAAGQGRIRTVNTTAWTLIEVQYVVDDLDWFGIGDDVYTVADVEEVRGVMFWGDFVNTNLADGGSLWFDNIKMEVFKNQASVTANTSPDPTLSEGGTPGDFDGDDDVDGNDFLLIQRGIGSTTDASDIEDFKNNFGTSVPAAGAVPEPTTIALMLVGLGASAIHRRRRAA